MRNTVLLFAAVLGIGCARYMGGESGGEVIDPAVAKQTVVLHVNNMNTQPMELRTITNGESRFVGSVGGSDSTNILLDPGIFPTGSLYLTAIPGDGIGRAITGPLAATKGDRIRFTIEPALDRSHALVVR